MQHYFILPQLNNHSETVKRLIYNYSAVTPVCTLLRKKKMKDLFEYTACMGNNIFSSQASRVLSVCHPQWTVAQSRTYWLKVLKCQVNKVWILGVASQPGQFQLKCVLFITLNTVAADDKSTEVNFQVTVNEMVLSDTSPRSRWTHQFSAFGCTKASEINIINHPLTKIS